MAVLTSIRCCNLTPFDRRQIVTSMVPLNAGQVTGSGSKVWTARNAIGDGGGGREDVAVQATQVGPSHPDGSWRMARIHFPAEIEAATTGYQTYPLWKERAFDIDTDPTGLPTFTEDATTTTGLSGLQFTLTTRGRPLNSALPTTEHSVTFTPEAGTIPDYHAPYTVSNPAKAEQADTSGLSNTWIRAYRVSGRVLPEADGGSSTEPSYVGTLYYEVSSAASGFGRFVRFWFEACNSLVTPDADPRDDTTIEYELQRDVTLDITCSTTTVRVQIDATSGHQLDAPTPITNGYRVQCYAYAPQINRGDEQAPHLSGCLVRGVLFFPGALSTIEQGTRSAINYGQGDQAFLTGIATNWADTSVYGAFGVVHKPEHVFHASLSDWRDQIARKVYGELTGRMRNSRYGAQFIQYPSYTHRLGSGSAGGSMAFGGSTLSEFASTAHPDLRPVYLSVRQDVYRPQQLRDVNGDVWDASVEVPPTAGMTSNLDSAMAFFNGQPWWQDVGQERGGKGAALTAKTGLPSGPDATTSYVNSHMEFGCPIFYAFLTADRYFLDRYAPNMREVVLATRPVSTTYDSNDYGGGFDWTGISSGSIGDGVPRSEGRPLKMHAHLYALLGSADLATKMDLRLKRLYEWATLGIPQNGRDPGFGNDIELILRDSSLFARNGSGYNCDTGAKVWDDQGDDSWIPWQNAILTEGIYGCTRMLELAGGFSTGVTQGTDMAARMGKSILVHGYKPDGDSFGAIFGIDWEHNPLSAGDAPDWDWTTPTEFYCNAAGSRLSDKYGPLNPDRGNQPYYRDNSGGSYIQSMFPGALIGAVLNPGDADVQAAIAAKLTTRKVTPDNDSIRANASNPGDDGWFQIANVVSQPFTRWVSGPQTYQGSGTTAMVVVDATGAASATRLYQSAGTASIVDIAASGRGYINDTHQGSGSTAVVTFAASGSASATRVYQSSGTAAVVTVSASGNWSSVVSSDSTGSVGLEGDDGGSDDGPDPPTTQGQTIREALGPSGGRARGVKIIRTPDGFTRISYPKGYRGPLRRREYP